MRIKLQIPFKISEILSALDIQAFEKRNEVVEFITTDTRDCEARDLFIALQGEKRSGTDYVPEAIKKGAYVVASVKDENVFYTDDTRLSLLKLARAYKKKLVNLKYTVGVTGSVGKSTTKEFLREILSEKYAVHATEGNLNNHLGVPITILTADENTELLILEMGMNSSGEIAELSSYTNPDVAIITSVGTAHIGRLGSRENIAKAKLEILLGMTVGSPLIIPQDEPLLSVDGAYRVALGTADADLNLSVISETPEKTEAKLFTKDRSFCISVNLRGVHLMKNLSLAIAAGISLKMSDTDIINGVFKISSDNIRQKIVSCGKFLVLDDSYNSSKEAVFAAIDTLIKQQCKIRSCLFSDMLELGEYSAVLHFDIGKYAAQCGVKKLYAFGEYSAYVKAGALAFGIPESCMVIQSEDESLSDFVARIYYKTEEDEIILAKASHATKMGTVLKMLMERCKEENAR